MVVFRFTISQLLLVTAVIAGIFASAMVVDAWPTSFFVTVMGLFLLRTYCEIGKMTREKQPLTIKNLTQMLFGSLAVATMLFMGPLIAFWLVLNLVHGATVPHDSVWVNVGSAVGASLFVLWLLAGQFWETFEAS